MRKPECEMAIRTGRTSKRTLILCTRAFRNWQRGTVVGSGPTNPTATKAYRMIDNKLPVYGITRVTRHPRLCGVSLWAIAHLLVNGNPAALIMFGALLVT